jgi:4'-phosphopantetheinyl transferase
MPPAPVCRDFGNIGGMLHQPFAHGAAHVWSGTSTGRVSSAEFALLSAAERGRARTLPEAGAQWYAAAHVALREILAGYLSVDPAELQLGRSRCPGCASRAHGAPAVVWPPTAVTFSLSRSGASWLLAVTEGKPIGADLETGSGADPLRTSAVACTPREQQLLRGLADPAERRKVFLRCWTRKEAVVKAVGIGLAADLRQIDTSPERDGPVEVRYGIAPGPQSWLVQEPDFGPGAHAAVARTADSGGSIQTLRYGGPAAEAAPDTR